MTGGRQAGPEDPGSDSRVTAYVALAANLVIAAAKLAAALATGSAVLLAETAHSPADSANQLILAISVRLGRRPPDDEHEFGHGKEQFFLGVRGRRHDLRDRGGIRGGRGSVRDRRAGARGGRPHHRIRRPRPRAGRGGDVARAGRVAPAAKCRRGRVSFRRFVSETRNPTPRVVLFEDGAAVVGIALGFAGLALRQVTGSAVWDGVASILVGVLLVGVAISIGAHARDLLLGESARPDVRRALEDAARRHDGVESVTDLLTMHVGPEAVLVVARVELRDDLRVPDVERLAAGIRDDMRQVDPAVTYVFLHPADGSASPTAA